MKPLVIGVGNRDRGDDALGPLVIDALRAICTVAETCIVEGDLSDLTLRWSADQDVIIVDAVMSGASPGDIIEIDAVAERLPNEGQLLSSHGISLADAIELGRLLQRMPRRLTVIGVEAYSFDGLTTVNPAVAESIPKVVTRINDLLAAADGQQTDVFHA